MALARYGRDKEVTLGKGDCAFNAFVLALSNHSVLNQIERAIADEKDNIDELFQDFVVPASVALNVNPDWKSVKSELLRLHDADKEGLQNKIAPVMRKLSIDIAMYSPDAVFLKSKTVAPLVSAYGDYQRSKQGKEAHHLDDIFSRHTFITNKFYEVYYLRNKDKTQRKKIIENWWWNEGYDQFLAEMKKGGVWAGDIELARLAKYFNVVLDVIPDAGFLYNIHGNYGYFPYLNDSIAGKIPYHDRASVIENLKSRFIVAQDHEGVHPEGVNFVVPNLSVILNRLIKVPNHEAVMIFILKQQPLKGVIVPDTWSKACKDELIQRNVIGRGKNGNEYVFLVNGDDAMMRIDKIDYHKEIGDICRKYFQALPTLILHKSPDHWSNTLRVITPEEREMQLKLATQLSANKSSLFSGSLGFAGGAQLKKNPLRLSGDSVVRSKT